MAAFPRTDLPAPRAADARATAGARRFTPTAPRDGEFEAAAQLAAIVESSDDAIVGMTLDGTITSWNAGAERIYHYDRAEMLGRPVTLLATSDEQQADVQAVLALVAGGEATRAHETVARRKDGVIIDVMMSVSPIRDPAGAVIGVAGMGRARRLVVGAPASRRR
jgi:PAS domain S-box-containing protein